MFNYVLERTGDQDWFNMLSWSHPELFYILPCIYNWQTSVQVRVSTCVDPIGIVQNTVDKFRMASTCDSVEPLALIGSAIA
jgi:hypothetical protein